MKYGSYVRFVRVFYYSLSLSLSLSLSTYHVALLNDVLSDLGSSIVLGFGPLQVHEVLVPVGGLGLARLLGWVCEGGKSTQLLYLL